MENIQRQLAEKSNTRQPNALPGQETKSAPIILGLNPRLSFSIILLALNPKAQILTLKRAQRKLLGSPTLM